MRYGTALLLGFLLSTERLLAQVDTSKLVPQSEKPARLTRSNGMLDVAILGLYDSRSGEPIKGVEVRDSLSGISALTTKDGAVALNFLQPVGPFYLFTVRKEGYEPKKYRIRVDSLHDMTEMLEPHPIGTGNDDGVLLPGVNVEGRYRLDTDPGKWEGFTRRCSTRHAECVAELELAKHPSARVYDFLVRSYGIIAECTISKLKNATLTPSALSKPPREPGSKSCLAKMHPSAGTGSCTPTYIVNGKEWVAHIKPAQEEIEDFIGPTQMKGIEVYSSEKIRPLSFNGKPMCGTVVIWTK